MTQPTTFRPEKYERLPFVVEAVELTAANIEEVAAWCGGIIRTSGNPKKGNVKRYLKIEVKRALNDRQTMAYEGDWVLRAGSGFKVYTPKAFSESFRKTVDHMLETVGNMVEREKAEDELENDQVDSTTEDSLPQGGTNTSFLSAS